MPSLSLYITRRFPIKLQADMVRHEVSFLPDGSKRAMTPDLTLDECRQIVDENVLTPAAGNHRHLRFVGFEQARVDELGACFDTALAMLTEARRHVGLHTWRGKTPYESVFGAHAWHGSSATRKAGLALGNANAESGFASRASYVRNKIDQMAADMSDARWLVCKSNDVNDAAALKGGVGGYLMEIGAGFPLGPAGHYHAGVLIHEVGHNQGLADVCDQCQHHRPLLEGAHFMPHADANIPQCTGNKPHGHMAASGRGHFIGAKQVKRLAENHKNATVYNTDSYRLYCYAFFKNEAAAGLAEHKRLLPPK